MKLATKTALIFILFWLLMLAAMKSGFSQRDTTICQQWKIEVDRNLFAIKDTCFTIPLPCDAVSDTVWLTNNVLFRGERGPQGPQGPAGGGGGGFFEQGWHNVADYGAIPNDGISDEQAFIAARDAAIADGSLKIFVPQGDFNITSIDFRVNFGSWKLKGAGITDNGTINDRGSRLICGNTSGGCLNFVAVRLADISDIELRGGNNFPTTITDRTNTALWDSKSWANGFDISRYNAHSGLSFDMEQPVAPWGAQVLVNRIKVTGFNVGINISGGRDNMQGDTYMVRDSKLWHNVYAASVGQDQCRAVTFDNVTIEGSYCAYTNVDFGRGNGSGFNVLNSQITTCFKLLNTTTAYRGPLTFTNVFTEAIGMIGTIAGLGVNQNAAIFTGCEFGFDDNGYSTANGQHWSVPAVVLNVGSNTIFNGCNFHTKKSELLFGGSWYQFNGSTFTQTRNIFFQYPHDVQINGVAKFREDNYRLEDNPTINHGQDYYIRPQARMLTIQQGNGGYKRVIYEHGGPIWQQVAWATDNGQKVQIIDCDGCAVGDYLNALEPTLGEAAIPGFKVVSVANKKATIERMAADVQGSIIYNKYLWFVKVRY